MGRENAVAGRVEADTPAQVPATPTPGRSTLQPPGGGDESSLVPDHAPDGSWTFKYTRNGVSLKGTIKLDAFDAGVVAQTDNTKTQGATLNAAREIERKVDPKTKTAATKATNFLALALVEQSVYGKPFSWMTVELKTKVLEQKLGQGKDGLKLLTLSFGVKGKLPKEAFGDIVGSTYQGSFDVEAEVGISANDLTQMTKLRGLADEAADIAEQVRLHEDKIRDSEKLIDEWKKDKEILERVVRGNKRKWDPPVDVRQAQSKLAQLKPRMTERANMLKRYESALEGFKKIADKLHLQWVDELAKLSPLLRKFQSEIAEKLAQKLAVKLAGKVFSKVHPILAIITTIADLLYIVKFFIDWLLLDKIRYAGWGKGDYEPSLLDWSTGGAERNANAGNAPTATPTPTPAPTENGTVDAQAPTDAQKQLQSLKGPASRLVALVLQKWPEQQLEPRHHERLLSILELHPVTEADVAELIRRITPLSSPDAGLTALSQFLERRNAERAQFERTTATQDGGTREGDKRGETQDTGDKQGTGTKQGTGSGDGDGDTGGREAAIRNPKVTGVVANRTKTGTPTTFTLSGSTATIVVGVGPSGAPVTISLAGRAWVEKGFQMFKANQPGEHTVEVESRRWNQLEKRWEWVPSTVTVIVPEVIGRKLATRTRIQRKR